MEVEVAEALDGQVDAVYMHDPLIMSGRGRHPAQHGQAGRACASPATRRPSSSASTSPCSACSRATPTLDGGDHFWLDDTHGAVGLGYRTNRKGAQALQALVEPEGIHVEAYDMPHDQGPDYVLHLQSFLSAATEELFVVFEPLAPVRLLQDIKERGIDWIKIDEESYHAMGCNVLAVRPGVVVMVDGAPKVRKALEARGVEVHAYDGTDLSPQGRRRADVLDRAAAASVSEP